MARPAVRGLTENELMIMRVLWENSPLSIGEVLERLPRKPKPAYNSLLTVMRILERKGHVVHRKEGKAFLYSPKLDRHAYRGFELGKLISGIFNGDALELAVSLLKSRALSEQEKAELKRLLEEL